MLGYHAPFSTTYKIMLNKNRLVHSSNVTFSIADCVHISPAEAAAAAKLNIDIYPGPPTNKGAATATENTPDDASEDVTIKEAAVKPSYQDLYDLANWDMPKARIDIEHCDLFNQLKATSGEPPADNTLNGLLVQTVIGTLMLVHPNQDLDRNTAVTASAAISLLQLRSCPLILLRRRII